MATALDTRTQTLMTNLAALVADYMQPDAAGSIGAITADRWHEEVDSSSTAQGDEALALLWGDDGVAMVWAWGNPNEVAYECDTFARTFPGVACSEFLSLSDAAELLAVL